MTLTWKLEVLAQASILEAVYTLYKLFLLYLKLKGHPIYEWINA